jgi:hypothetical protein
MGRDIRALRSRLLSSTQSQKRWRRGSLWVPLVVLMKIRLRLPGNRHASRSSRYRRDEERFCRPRLLRRPRWCASGVEQWGLAKLARHSGWSSSSHSAPRSLLPHLRDQMEPGERPPAPPPNNVEGLLDRVDGGRPRCIKARHPPRLDILAGYAGRAIVRYVEECARRCIAKVPPPSSVLRVCARVVASTPLKRQVHSGR